tara:strand:+ start:1904 stop:2095 length:192 start_codon:yes stop_codon:yes gene_type:complete
MALYKAKDSFKTFKGKACGIHADKILKEGGSIEITDFNALPKSVRDHLEPVETKKPKAKKENK